MQTLEAKTDADLLLLRLIIVSFWPDWVRDFFRFIARLGVCIARAQNLSRVNLRYWEFLPAGFVCKLAPMVLQPRTVPLYMHFRNEFKLWKHALELGFITYWDILQYPLTHDDDVVEFVQQQYYEGNLQMFCVLCIQFPCLRYELPQDCLRIIARAFRSSRSRTLVAWPTREGWDDHDYK
jgi:hypothetical protein